MHVHWVYMYIYIYIYTGIYMYIYIYFHTHTTHGHKPKWMAGYLWLAVYPQRFIASTTGQLDMLCDVLLLRRIRWPQNKDKPSKFFNWQLYGNFLLGKEMPKISLKYYLSLGSLFQTCRLYVSFSCGTVIQKDCVSRDSTITPRSFWIRGRH